jgi:hypothetical protein
MHHSKESIKIKLFERFLQLQDSKKKTNDLNYFYKCINILLNPENNFTVTEEELKTTQPYTYISTYVAMGLIKHFYANKMWLDEYEELMTKVQIVEEIDVRNFENKVQFEELFLILTE